MITELTNSDNAGTVVSRINTAITEQNKGVDTLGADPNAGSVISCVNATIDAEDNNELVDVFPSDNAADFIRKTNALFASINAGGGDEPTPPEPDYAYWSGKKYIAFGDSITHTSWTVALDKRYCFLAAQELGMTTFTNAGVSGMMMLDNSAFRYPITPGTNSGIESVPRCFSKELLSPIDNPNTTQIVDIVAAQNASVASNYDGSYRGPYGYNLVGSGTPLKLWEYDLISIMLGTNDIWRSPNKVGSWEDTGNDTFFGAYKNVLDHITTLLAQKNATNTVIVICVPPPQGSGSDFHIENIEGAVREIAGHYTGSHKLRIVDFYNECPEIQIESTMWKVHPTETGHRTMADYFKLRLGEIAAELHLSDN
jgi:lysophospholipase L1-like esterase